MRSVLSSKFALISLVVVIILIPLNLIDGLLQERQTYHREAIDEMARSSTAAQRLLGPVLWIPCTETYPVEYYDAERKKNRLRRDSRDCSVHVLPTKLVVGGQMESDLRRRGVHEALFFTSKLTLSASFLLPERFGTGEPGTEVKTGEASLNIGISDTRGVMAVPSVRIDGRSRQFAPGTQMAVLGTGVHAAVGVLDAGQTIATEFDLNLRGHEQLTFVPLGRETEMHLRSSWPHPSFIGRFLPSVRQVSSKGFEADWGSSHFATGLEQLFARHARDLEPCPDINETFFGVTLIDPVDLYTQVDRAQKYGFLFVVMTFIAMFGLEFMRRVRLHPLQYTLVGVALAIFFLLLLSLAEHTGFAPAYAMAASACVGLLSFYMRHIVRSRATGLGFALTLSVFYGLLYTLLVSEDYALLTGAVFVFGVLALIMVLTRHVDWYALSASAASGAETSNTALPAAVA